MSRLSYPTVVMGVLLLAGCGSAGSTGGGLRPVNAARLHVGIIGKVRRSPIYPMTSAGVDNSAPVSGAQISVELDGREKLGVAVSDSSGVFALVLAPGTYLLTPLPLEAMPNTAPPAAQRVVVPDDGIGRVTFNYDTGIR
ncbi:MAG: hypothetical protein JWQ98_481 [Chlorobi bacterium]|jgi:Trk-type K+ transport system membrane component|nr:hypothetical protein [Chlorobiota bacterium]